jgi:hypothetical protein
MRFLFVLILLTAAAPAFSQRDFSADIVGPQATNPFHTRIYATRNKLRFQQQDNGGNASSIMLVNLAELTSVVLIPQQHTYLKQSKPQIPGQGVAFFQPQDVANACTAWKQMGELKGTCHSLGKEVVNGRDTVKYENLAPDKSASYIWIDTLLHFPVKWEGKVGTRELRNIQEAPQPADLFEIPEGYTKHTLAVTSDQ